MGLSRYVTQVERTPCRRRAFSRLVVAVVVAVLCGSGGASAQTAGSINDLLKGSGSGSSSGSMSATEPAAGQNSGGSFTLPGLEPRQDQGSLAGSLAGTGGSQPFSGPAPVSLAYDGEASGDGRKARIELAFDATSVTGTIRIESICEQNFHLGGADLTFSASLTGSWESKDGTIDGGWQGTEHFCGSDMPNHGTLKFFLKDDGYFDPILHLRLTGERGQYGWNFPPTGKLFVEAGAASAASPPNSGTTAKPKNEDGKEPKTPPEEEIDPNRVTDLVMLPSLLAMAPGETAELPYVQAVIGDEAQRVNVPESALSWGGLPAGPLDLRDGKLFLGLSARDGAEIPFSVTVTLGALRQTLDGRVRVYAKEQLGSISGIVYFVYSPTLIPGPGLRPRSAEVELHRGTSLGSPIAVIPAAADGSFRFDNLPKGYYVVGVRKLVPPAFPAGYVLNVGSAPWRSTTTAIPDRVWVETANEMQVVWDRQHISVGANVFQPPATDGAIYGRVYRNDKGVEGVTVWAHQVGSTGVKAQVRTNKNGNYVLKIDDLPGGTYWITAEKYVTPQWAGPDDLLDVASTRLETPILVSSPLSDPRGVEVNIEVDTRNAIFGGDRTPIVPPPLPGEE